MFKLHNLNVMLSMIKYLCFVLVSLTISNLVFAQENETNIPILCAEIDSDFTVECLITACQTYICTDMYFEGNYLGRKSYYDSLLIQVSTIKYLPGVEKWENLDYDESREL